MFLRPRYAWCLALLTSGLCEATAQPPPPPTVTAPSSAPHMTTDTAEFCAHLNGEVVQMRETTAWPSPIARRLASEGRHFCAEGLYRAGVMRLRRALIMLRDSR